MASSPSPLLGVELQALGENLNTWGDTKLNDVIKRLEEAITGAVSIAVEANVTLTSTDYVQNQARYSMLIFTGSGGFNITCPATAKHYLVKNDCSAAVTFTHGSGTTVAVAAGAIKWVATDGTDFFTAEEQDYLLLSGGTLTGDLTLAGAPTSNLHAATKAYADTMLPLAGGTMTGFIVLHTETPTNDLHPASKGYVDDLAFNAVDLPGQSGNAGKYLTTDGSAASWGTISVAFADLTGKPTTLSGYGITDGQPLDATLTALAGLTTANGNIIYATGVDTFSQVTSTTRGRNELTRPSPAHINNTDSPYSASFGEEIFVDCSTGAVEIDLPAATAGSLPILITDDDGSSVTNNITIDPNGAETIAGQSTIEIDQARASILLVPFAGSWRIAN